MERKATYNSTSTIGGVSCSADSFVLRSSLVVAESFVLRIKVSGKNPAHRQAVKRWRLYHRHSTMDWKEYITGLNLTDKTSSFDFNIHTSDNLLEDLQIHFGLKELPRELEEFYRQTNGVDELLGGQKIGELIWSIDRVN